MSKLKYYDGTEWKTVNGQITGDTLPIGSEVDFDGETVPVGWQEIDSPDAYSTSEVKTNKIWVNNKPVYRKVVDIGNLPNNSRKEVAHNITNLDDIIYCSAIIDNGTTYRQLPVSSPLDTNYAIDVYANSTYIVIDTGNDRTSYSGYAIVEYTKTTD